MYFKVALVFSNVIKHIPNIAFTLVQFVTVRTAVTATSMHFQLKKQTKPNILSKKNKRQSGDYSKSLSLYLLLVF